MNAILCKVFGHKFRECWVGARSGYFGAIVVNYKTCEQCDKSEYEYSTDISMKPIELHEFNLKEGDKE